jgi:phospholipid/cholesterol/gamma-HCH transport system substrate-binding protein
MDALVGIWRSKVLRISVAFVVLIAAVVVVVEVLKPTPSYPIKVVYASAPGLFPGAAVDVLGVPVGTVTAVTNVDNQVDVVLSVHTGTKIPAAAVASLVAPEVLGQPDVDLNPGYTSGPALASGSTIPESRTSVPVSTDQFLKELQRTLKALNPHAVSDLITNLAVDLDGQGQNLNNLIHSAAGTIALLAAKGNDLGQLNGTLAQLTGTLDSDTAQIEQLVQQYDTVSTVIAQHSGQLNDALTQLTGATTALVTLLTPNLQPLESDVGTLTTTSRTLDRNLSTIDEILQQTNNLFQGASRAVDTNYDWLDLNSALPLGVTGAVETGYVVDALAGICRRIKTNYPAVAATLTGPNATALTDCTDPNSPFYDTITSQIPTLLNQLSKSTNAPAAPSPESLLQQGLSKIGSITTPTTTTPSKGSTTPAPTTTTTTTKAPAPTTTTTTTPCTLLNAILGCSNKSGSNSGSTKTSGGLLSQRITAAGTQQATVALDKSSTPTLTAPAANLLPPMPSSDHAHAHRGDLAEWAHDVSSWF